MAKLAEGGAANIHYAVTTDDGTAIDSSKGGAPMKLTLGKGDFFAEVEKKLIGMSAGDSIEVTLSPDQAFGPHHKELVMEVEKSGLPDDIEPEIGMKLGADTPEGDTIKLTVTSIEGDKVILDANHPLAGQTLVVTVDIVEVL